MPGRGNQAYPDDYLYDTLGLVRLGAINAQLPVSERMSDNMIASLSESRMREIRTSGSMSGRWKRSMVRLVRHRQTKGPATDRPHLNHRATSRLYLDRDKPGSGRTKTGASGCASEPHFAHASTTLR